MKINYKNKDLKIINQNRGYRCASCAFKPQPNFYYCSLFCSFDKIWIEDISNSDIFRL